ncbi:hypothetical protein ACWATR_35840 [Nostoc sp. UIC 10890]
MTLGLATDYSERSLTWEIFAAVKSWKLVSNNLLRMLKLVIKMSNQIER